MTNFEIKEILEELVEKYNNISFIENDPISIPHKFSDKNDIEISGFLAATIAWGRRDMIIRNSTKMMNLMGNEPYRFIKEASDSDLIPLMNFVHRTFNGEDFVYFIKSLRNIYNNHGGIGSFFEDNYAKTGDIRPVLSQFWTLFFELDHNIASQRHLSSIAKKSACKRLCMYIRWLVRDDNKGVDFGLWKSIPSSALYLPLDLHSGNVSREFGLLTRKQNDWNSVEQVTSILREFDPIDPVKYDFALFGLGVNRTLDR